jgi:GNAT superfamily N-acetyltransferase
MFTSDATVRFLAGQIICDKLVVHPHYRARGHATLLLRWGLCMAELDGVNQGVIPSHMGEPVYRGLGYEFVGEIDVPGDDETEGFSLRVMSYRAQSSHRRMALTQYTS